MFTVYMPMYYAESIAEVMQYRRKLGRMIAHDKHRLKKSMNKLRAAGPRPAFEQLNSLRQMRYRCAKPLSNTDDYYDDDVSAPLL
jgi:hypothetical protein